MAATDAPGGEREKKGACMISYFIDEGGQCSTVSYPTHEYLMRLVAQHHLDHVMHCCAPAHVPFVAYLSLQSTVMFLCAPLGAAASGWGRRLAATSEELAGVYRWALLNRHRYAYPYLRTDVVPPTPNVCLTTRSAVAEWCDAQIDAFILFRCKQVLRQRRRKSEPGGAG